jgi:hypothetical protein
MVVWLSVPTTGVRVGDLSATGGGLVSTTVARYSRLTWWTMPVAGGTARKFLKACWPHLRNS